MALEPTTEQEARLRRIAGQDGKTPAQVLDETLQSLADEEAERKVIEDRLDEAENGIEWIYFPKLTLTYRD